MEENCAFVFQGGGPTFLPRLLEAGVYTDGLLPDAKQAVWRPGRPKADYFLFHCIKGSCTLLCRQKEYPLAQGCILLLDGKQTVEATANEACQFAAFRFQCERGRPPLRAGRVYAPPPARMEEPFYAALAQTARLEEQADGRQLGLMLAMLCYEWKGDSLKSKKKTAAASAYEADIRKAVAYLKTHLEEKIQLSELAKELHLSERNFRKRFTEEMGVSPKAYLQAARLGRAKELLRAGEQSISEISEAVGYYSQFQFSRDFKKEFGLTPSAYRGGKETAPEKKPSDQIKK